MPIGDEICGGLHALAHRLTRNRFPPPSIGIPANGIYFAFEKGEAAHGGDRIVRIGSHTGKGNLRARLFEHITPNKDRSIFRKNLGRALLNRVNDPFLDNWERGLTSRREREQHGPLVDRVRIASFEATVSEYVMWNISFSVIAVEEAEDALALEARCIATISLCSTCRPSANWLGRASPKTKIRDSGLWQVQHLYKKPLLLDDLRLLENLACSPKSFSDPGK